MDTRQAIKDSLNQLRSKLKHLGIDSEDMAEAVVQVLREDTHNYFEIDKYYDQRGHEIHKARQIEYVAKAKATVAEVRQMAQQSGIDVVSELESATAKIAENVRLARVAIEEAEKLAKEHGIPFSSSANGVRNTFNPNDGWSIRRSAERRRR
jgi:regulator of replication initiation timing